MEVSAAAARPAFRSTASKATSVGPLTDLLQSIFSMPSSSPHNVRRREVSSKLRNHALVGHACHNCFNRTHGLADPHAFPLALPDIKGCVKLDDQDDQMGGHRYIEISFNRILASLSSLSLLAPRLICRLEKICPLADAISRSHVDYMQKNSCFRLAES